MHVYLVQCTGRRECRQTQHSVVYDVHPPMVLNPVYNEVLSPRVPAPPYFKTDPCQFGNREVVVHMDTRYHDVPQRKSAEAESLYDYIDMQ